MFVLCIVINVTTLLQLTVKHVTLLVTVTVTSFIAPELCRELPDTQRGNHVDNVVEHANLSLAATE